MEGHPGARSPVAWDVIYDHIMPEFDHDFFPSETETEESEPPGNHLGVGGASTRTILVFGSRAPESRRAQSSRAAETQSPQVEEPEP